MNPHFFTVPFYFAFIWFKVQGSGFRVQVAASPPFYWDDARKWHLKLATPISNGGLFGTPPGFCTDTCLWQV